MDKETEFELKAMQKEIEELQDKLEKLTDVVRELWENNEDQDIEIKRAYRKAKKADRRNKW